MDFRKFFEGALVVAFAVLFCYAATAGTQQRVVTERTIAPAPAPQPQTVYREVVSPQIVYSLVAAPAIQYQTVAVQQTALVQVKVRPPRVKLIDKIKAKRRAKKALRVTTAQPVMLGCERHD